MRPEPLNNTHFELLLIRQADSGVSPVTCTPRAADYAQGLWPVRHTMDMANNVLALRAVDGCVRFTDALTNERQDSLGVYRGYTM